MGDGARGMCLCAVFAHAVSDDDRWMSALGVIESLEEFQRKSMRWGTNTRRILVPATLGVIACAALIVLDFHGFMGSAWKDNCSFTPAYASVGHGWDQLPPATVEQNSDGCVGFCFTAVVDREESTTVARVVILEDDDVLTRGIVERTEVTGILDLNRAAAAPLRFACFARVDGVGDAPRFESCVQMPALGSSASGCETEPEFVSQGHRFDQTDSGGFFKVR